MVPFSIIFVGEFCVTIYSRPHLVSPAQSRWYIPPQQSPPPGTNCFFLLLTNCFVLSELPYMPAPQSTQAYGLTC